MRRLFLFAGVLLAAAGCTKQPAWEALPLGTSADFRAIAFTDANHGWIAGGGFQVTGGLIGRTEDGGKTWRFSSDLTPREGLLLTALHMFDSQHGLVATGGGQIFNTTNGGKDWTEAARRGRADSFSSLFFLDDRRGWAAGHGDVLRTDDGGDSWSGLTPEGVDTAYRAPVRAVQFLDNTRGFAAGNQASLLRTADSGVTWEAVRTPFASGEHPNLWDLFFVDEFTGWVVGEEGTILATTDGGRMWKREPVTVDAGDRTPAFTISAVRFVDASHGWMAGFYAGLGRSLILRTADAGATWTTDADIAGEELHTLFVQGRDRLWAIGSRVREGPQSIYRRALTK